MKIALIAGARAGKDTFANYVSMYGIERVAFGDALREKFFSTFPTIPEAPKPRRELILYGQICVTIDEMVWVRPTSHKIEALLNCGANGIVVTDCRQVHEYNYLEEQGFTFVRIETTATEQIERSTVLGECLDVNNGMDNLLDNIPCDYIIDNKGTIEEFYNNIDLLLGEMEVDSFGK